MSFIRSRFRFFLMPMILLVSFGALVRYEAMLPLLPPLFWPALFYFLAVAAMMVSWHFNRSRFIFLLLPMMVLYWALNTFDIVTLHLLKEYIVFVLSGHILLFLWLKERGIFTFGGVARLLIIVFEIGVLYMAIRFYPEWIQVLKQYHLFVPSIETFFSLNTPAVITIGITTLLLLLLSFLYPLTLYAAAFFAIYMLMLSGLYYIDDTFKVSMAFIHATVLIFTVLMIESYRLAFFDELTELPGRRALMEAMTGLGRNYAIAMVDIDHFKKFNDTYGHDTGDDVLKLVAGILATVKGGKAYRYGGEEFTVLFPSRSREKAAEEMDAIREKIAQTSFLVRRSGSKKKSRGKKVFVYISAGVVGKSAADKTVNDVMKRSDKALYKAKKSGRNKVVKG